MLPIKARGLYIKKEAHEDPRSMARVERMLPFIHCPTELQVIDDSGWDEVVRTEQLNRLPRHGNDANSVEPVVMFNQFLYEHTLEEREARKKQYLDIFGGQYYTGYSGWDWRESGSEDYRRKTGLVCQPAYAIHSFWGCHFRCNYCNLGNVANIFVNLEDWVKHIEHGLANLERTPDQTIFQWDNGTDIVCFEPEYGGTKLLVDLFARQPGKYLELYVGKSDYVDFLLDYDHRGHTICCWSLGTATQCREYEKRTASLENRILSARKCQEVGYTVRFRFSPMIPHVGWEEETRHMIQRVFEETEPDVITMEPLRFHTYGQLEQLYPEGTIDPIFMEAMRTMPDDVEPWQKSQLPMEQRIQMYRLVLDEVERLSPHTPVGLCREKRTVWEAMESEFARMGQHPDNYVCNCGTTSAGSNPLLAPNRPRPCA